jgi:hypothetical protein
MKDAEERGLRGTACAGESNNLQSGKPPDFLVRFLTFLALWRSPGQF